ncbi:von Willebrand factor type A domain-containing protein [Alisedimentitalea sp. MJ-SS2]|uniref:vWA domain-containing protein n=1 Tax=Aliisedimentitalea sp. MJ-SS2 TaxID=3049795 RepID=UPI002911F91D|nr:von Willebrand factor type A domain-containing protein [Alisedimentitalea sp. MJ-SS2]MDU8929304.1 von Willebrand factor type A domain-containing protein [Alisedimentitalea sp. MJ-SS2]
MTDDLDDLKALMEQATPSPDPAKKAAHITLARENFARHQETAAKARQTSERPKPGLIRGAKTMFAHLTSRAALTASTALVAVGLVVALPQLTKAPLPDLLPAAVGTEPEPTQSGLEYSETARSGAMSPQQASKPAEPQTETTAPPLPPVADQAMPAPSSITPNLAFSEAEGDVFSDDAPLGRIAPAQAKPKSLPNRERRAMSDGVISGFGGMLAEQVAPGAVPMPAPDARIMPPLEPNTEAFPEAEKNPLKVTAEEPVSTFSIDVDTASYAVVRSSITRGQLPPQSAVRIEEMINYFPYDYPAPDAGEAPFKPTVTVTPTPWNDGTNLVHIAIQGREAATENRPPLNLVFLIDTSGSMNQPNKLPLLKQSLSLMLPQLDEQDQISIVTYAGSAGQVLSPTPATDRATIMAALDNLRAGGSTAGQAGLQQAYSVAETMATEGEVTRVILATDGDFNVGLSDPDQLKDFIADKRETGTYLSVMGFGRGNLDDATMQALAQNGNGQASYIDTLSEAQKVLVDQFTGALFPIANDVKIQVEFNPAQIAEYRLIGYETRALKREDFNNDKVDAGDIGAGHSVTAIYEVTPVGSPARLSDPLRYGATEPSTNITTELGFLKLRYKQPGAATSQLIEIPIRPDMGQPTDDIRFATAIAGFGELLKGSKFTSDWQFSDAIALATAARGNDPFGYRAEAIKLMRLADSLTP